MSREDLGSSCAATVTSAQDALTETPHSAGGGIERHVFSPSEDDPDFCRHCDLNFRHEAHLRDGEARVLAGINADALTARALERLAKRPSVPSATAARALANDYPATFLALVGLKPLHAADLASLQLDAGADSPAEGRAEPSAAGELEAAVDLLKSCLAGESKWGGTAREIRLVVEAFEGVREGWAGEVRRIEALEAKVARYEAPGGWGELRQREAYRVLGDPSKGVTGIMGADGMVRFVPAENPRPKSEAKPSAKVAVLDDLNSRISTLQRERDEALKALEELRRVAQAVVDEYMADECCDEVRLNGLIEKMEPVLHRLARSLNEQVKT